MFFLADLPDDATLDEFSIRYKDMDVSAVKSCLYFLRAGSDLIAGFETMLGRYGLSMGRFLTLMVMNRTPEDPLHPSELARKVGVTRPTMTGLLDNLVREKLVERVPDEDDRRKVLVRLTGKSRDLLEDALPDYYRRISGLMKGLNEKEREDLVGISLKVQNGLRNLMDD